MSFDVEPKKRPKGKGTGEFADHTWTVGLDAL